MVPDHLAADLEALDATFSGQPRPPCTKRVARALDDEWNPTASRIQELQRLDTENSWRDLSDEQMIEFCDVLFWMDPAAFRFYYPAFLAYALRHWDGTHNRIHDEAMESIADKPENIDSMTREEAVLVHRIIERLAATERGSGYHRASTVLDILARKANAKQLILPSEWGEEVSD